MSTSKRIHQPAVSGTTATLRDRIGDEAGSAPAMPWSEAEHEALLRAVPDQVFRIKLQEDGSVSVTGDRTRIRFPVDVLASPETNPDTKDKPDDLTSCLCRELARQAKGLMDESRRTGEVQTLELQVDHEAQATIFVIRAVACANGEVLVLVRGVACEESAGSIAVSAGKSPRQNRALQDEASLRPEDERILRDISTRMSCLLEDTIEAIQSIVQKKDPNTARHQARVWKLACAIGRQMGLGKTQVDVIGLAALLHDFGKVFIPDSILNKPGKLTEAEFSAVKNHAEAVFQILNTIDLFCPIADIVHQHHERMDGSGYPLGLKGEDILIEARIIAVADVVEAMLSARPYRPALGVEAAMKEIAAGRGRLYDADAVDACTGLFRDGKFEFDQE